MKLFLDEHMTKLLANGAATAKALADGEDQPDHFPVVKLFTPDAAATWLLSEIDPDEPDIAFGLCDLGMECAELGSVSLSELRSVRGRLGLPGVRSGACPVQTAGGMAWPAMKPVRQQGKRP